MIRRAAVRDVPTMHKLISDCAEYGLMLPRSLSSLYENVREFRVAVDVPDAASNGVANDGDGRTVAGQVEQVVGVCGLSIVWADLAEVVSLVVAPSHRGQGLGKRLVQACLDEAAQLGIRKVMTLTYEREFFERLGFSILDRQQLPLKVWSECVRCPKNQACDEIAMIRVLEQVPAAPAPQPEAPPQEQYIVPVTLSSARRSG